MGQTQYLSTDPNAGTPVSDGYLSTDPTAGERRPDFRVETIGDTSMLDKLSELLAPIRNFDMGVAKGAGRTAVGLGRAVHLIPGVDRLFGDIPAGTEQALGLDAEGAAQKLGMFLEQIGEFIVPGVQAEKAALALGSRLAPLAARLGKPAAGAARLLPQMAGRAASSAGVTAAQGGDPTTSAMVGGALPVVGAVASGAGRAVGRAAVPLVRAGIKPTVTAMKQQAGASRSGINAQANRIAKFIIDNRLTTPEKAEAIIQDAERAVSRLVGGQATDAPIRAQRYLEALERSAMKQGLPADTVATIQSAARELVKDSPFGETVTRTVQKASPSGLVTPSGKPVMVDVEETMRALRKEMPADEALATARGTSRWKTRRSYGEQKGASVESDKAVERAARDAVKTAVPDVKPVLQRESQAITAKQILDRQKFREGNRDAASLPAHVIAAGEIASGRVPILAFAANWLRNNQLKAGVWADRLSHAIDRKDVKSVSAILGHLGVGTSAQTTKPAYAR